MPTITLSVPEDLKRDMEESRDINWSEVARAAIKGKVAQLKILKAISAKSKLTEKSYNFDYDATVQRIKNPFNRKKEILLLAGKRTSGNASAVIAFTEYIKEVMKGNTKNPEQICRVVTGVDKDGDGVIDTVKFLE